jgi:hypothetical protein
MIKDILGFLAGFLGLFTKTILIIALCGIGVYCLGTAFMVPMVWDGLTRLGTAAGCVLGVIVLRRPGREKDGEPTEDDFRP